MRMRQRQTREFRRTAKLSLPIEHHRAKPVWRSRGGGGPSQEIQVTCPLTAVAVAAVESGCSARPLVEPAFAASCCRPFESGRFLQVVSAAFPALPRDAATLGWWPDLAACRRRHPRATD